MYTEIVPDVQRKILQALICGRADLESVIHTVGWKAYDGLVDLGYEKHFRVNHASSEFSKGDSNHINCIESFCVYAKHRFVKFNGIPKHLFVIYLKETEFRFNNKGHDLYQVMLKMCRNKSLC